jgi:hypothetical protein
MSENDFLLWAEGTTPNLPTQAAFAASANRGPGYAEGFSPAASEHNKLFRQSSLAAWLIGQFLNSKGYDAIDAGDTATLQANWFAALASLTPPSTGRFLGRRIFLANTTYIPTAGTSSIVVTCIGSGGSAGGVPATGSGQYSAAQGGGSGARTIKAFNSSLSGASIIVGTTTPTAAGAVVGANGGASYFYTISAGGGFGGGYIAPISTGASFGEISGGGLANTGGSPDESYAGQGGTPAMIITGSFLAIGGAGGSGPYGGSGFAGAGSGGGPGTAPGAGGGGGSNLPSSPARAGASGYAGIVYVDEYS